MDTPTGLTFDDLPQLFNAADRAAVDGRRRYMSQSGSRLVATVIAAGAAIAVIRIGRVDWAGIVSSAAFIVALLLDLSLLRARPERDWYDGRALAESAKTLGWKWAVGGNPYPCSQTLSDARMLLADDLSRLRASAGDVDWTSLVGSVVTDAMQALRDSPARGTQSGLTWPIASMISFAGTRRRRPTTSAPRGGGEASCWPWRRSGVSMGVPKRQASLTSRSMP